MLSDRQLWNHPDVRTLTASAAAVTDLMLAHQQDVGTWTGLYRLRERLDQRSETIRRALVGDELLAQSRAELEAERRAFEADAEYYARCDR